MKKIFIRSGMTPFEGLSPAQMLLDNSIGDNAGNLIYMNSIYRTLMTDDRTEFLPSRYEYYPSQARMINESCDSVVIPLADAFRSSFEGGLNSLTKLVKAVRVPCTVVGVGLRAPLGVTSFQDFPFNGKVKQFLSAVLDKSALVGVRGEITAEYLKTLGFLPEKHFTVIGCPSMYSRGLELPPARKTALGPGSRVSINYRKEQADNLYAFAGRVMALCPDYRLVTQRVEEMLMLRYGVPTVYTYAMRRDWNKPYPHNRRDPSVRAGKVFGYANALAWQRSMDDIDLSVGCRIHGNIAAVLSGAPAMVLTIDTRTEELCRYHNIPFIPADQINDRTDPRALYENTDFAHVRDGHAQRLRHFADFISANGIDHIYRDSLTPKDVPFDRALAALPAWGEIGCERHVSLSERWFGRHCIWSAVKGNVKWQLRNMTKKR